MSNSMRKHSMCALGNSLYAFSSFGKIQKAENASILSLMEWRKCYCFGSGSRRFYEAGITTIAENKILIFGTCNELSDIKDYDYFKKLYVYEFNTYMESLEKRKDLGIIEHWSKFTVPGN